MKQTKDLIIVRNFIRSTIKVTKDLTLATSNKDPSGNQARTVTKPKNSLCVHSNTYVQNNESLKMENGKMPPDWR